MLEIDARYLNRELASRHSNSTRNDIADNRPQQISQLFIRRFSNESPDMKRPAKTAPKEQAIRTRSRSDTLGSASTRRNLSWMSSCSESCSFAVQLLEGGLIPLVKKEQFALGQHLPDYLIEQLAP